MRESPFRTVGEKQKNWDDVERSSIGDDMKRDLTGKRYGKLTVLERTDKRKNGCIVWRCHCDCGKDVELSSRKLKEGVTTSCGCEARPNDLTGQRFGSLTVLGQTEKRTSNRSVLWCCRCDCGKEVLLARNVLVSGNTTSCGCWARRELDDLSGQRFGKLTVVSFHGKTNGHRTWNCRCDCGKETVVRESNLKNGLSKSCGCEHSPKKILHFVNGTCLEHLQTNHISKANTSGVRGVYFNKQRKKWIAQIMFRGKCHYLGGYDNFDEAVQARKKGEKMFLDVIRAHQKATNV